MTYDRFHRPDNCRLSDRLAMGKLAKHGLNITPLEAYGFLLGWPEPLVVAHCSLHLGKTTRWLYRSDRTARVTIQCVFGDKTLSR